MKKIEFKKLLVGLAIMSIVSATQVLFTGCGSSKSAVTSTDTSVAAEAPEYELTDDCALLHIYRPGSMKGMVIKYHIHLEDEPLFLVTNNSKTTVRITDAGQHILRAKTESSAEVPIDIQLGKEYYIRCGVRMGAVVARPSIEIVDAVQGKAECDKIKAKKK